MRKESLVSALVITALAGEAAACNVQPTISTNPEPQRNTLPTDIPTETPFQPPTLPASAGRTELPAAPTATKTPEQKMEFGTFDLGHKFKITTTPELMSTLGYIFTSSATYSVDKPMEVLLPYIEESIDARFAAASLDNSHGNPSIVFLTDVPNMIVEYVHSLQPHAPGEIVRILGSFAIKHPDRINEILGKNIIFTPEGQSPINGEIVDVRTVTADQFESRTHGVTFWGIYPQGDNVLLLRTDRMGIPESLRTDPNPNNHYMILISCQPKDGDLMIDPLHFAQESFHNTQNRTFVTVKITTP